MLTTQTCLVLKQLIVCFQDVISCSKSFFCVLSVSLSDLSEQIKAATKDNHVRAENTQLMLSYQKGQITLPQYKVSSTHFTHLWAKCSIHVYIVLKSGN